MPGFGQRARDDTARRRCADWAQARTCRLLYCKIIMNTYSAKDWCLYVMEEKAETNIYKEPTSFFPLPEGAHVCFGEVDYVEMPPLLCTFLYLFLCHFLASYLNSLFFRSGGKFEVSLR